MFFYLNFFSYTQSLIYSQSFQSKLSLFSFSLFVRIKHCRIFIHYMQYYYGYIQNCCTYVQHCHAYKQGVKSEIPYKKGSEIKRNHNLLTFFYVIPVRSSSRSKCLCTWGWTNCSDRQARKGNCLSIAKGILLASLLGLTLLFIMYIVLGCVLFSFLQVTPNFLLYFYSVMFCCKKGP